MTEVWRDIRYGLRLLWKSPGFTSVSLLALALGIGATTAIFGLLYSVLLAPLPYVDSDRIVMMTGRIYEAISALEQRRLNPVESNSDEDCALNKAEAGIKALITERMDRFVRNAIPGHWTIGL